tara:strand:+ start:1008 stop:1151 length:144 start_codon:yes stop_codon:yes gene_type:complete
MIKVEGAKFEIKIACVSGEWGGMNQSLRIWNWAQIPAKFLSPKNIKA